MSGEMGGSGGTGRDGGAGRDGGTGFWWDGRAALAAVRFFERVLTHAKGEWAGQGFALAPWQKVVTEQMFGWRRREGTRRYRRVYVEVPRKNGKSTWAAGVALLLLFADGEPGAEVYSCAADREQATIVFEMAKTMVQDSPVLSRGTKIYRRSIVTAMGASYKALSAEAYSKHGLNAHGIVFDELHAQPNRELWDVMTTSMGARRQPLLLAITTAGWDRESICWEQHEYARQVQEGVIQDDAFLPVVYGMGDEEDWTDRAIWRRVNPSLGLTVQEDFLEGEFERARQTPGYQNTFRRLYLNQWTSQESRWLDLGAWDGCGGEVDEGSLAGQVCYAGLDLASTTDIAALCLVFPGEDGVYRAVWRFWTPAETLRQRGLEDRAPYEVWVREGWLRATPGNAIDYEIVRAEIEGLGKVFQIREVAFDRWGATQMSQQLAGAGFTMVAMGQGFASMSAPTKELERLALSRQLAHGGNPVARWMTDNVMVAQDAAGNLKPNKGRSRGRIDGVVALIMALDRAVRHGTGGSIYDTQELRVL